jgi:hypothetical protein
MLDLKNVIWELRWSKAGNRIIITEIDNENVYFEDICDREDVGCLTIDKFCKNYKAVGELQ